ncbi:hypothetical protein D9M71_745710 [compost metagenome]
MLEQGAAQGAFQGMDRPMHADVTGLQLGSGPRQVAGAHESQEHLEFFQGQLFIDQHGADSFWNDSIVPNYSGPVVQKHCAFTLQA